MNKWITPSLITWSHFSQTNFFQGSSLAKCNISRLCSHEGKKYFHFFSPCFTAFDRDIFLRSQSFILYLQMPSTGCLCVWRLRETVGLKNTSAIRWGGPNLREGSLLCGLSLLLHHFRPAAASNVNLHTGLSNFTHPASNLWITSLLNVLTHVTSLFLFSRFGRKKWDMFATSRV